MNFFSKRISVATRLACAVGGFALAAGLAPAGDAIAQQAPDGISIQMADENGTATSSSASAMMAQAQEKGEISIIVGLDTSFTPEGDLSATAVAGQRAGIAAMQAQMMDALEGPSNISEFETVPYMAMTVSPEDLARVMSMPGVTSIHEDVPVPPTLSQSVPVIQGNDVWQMGYRGNGVIVVVMDTGMRLNHSAFSDPGGPKAVASACFNTNNSQSSSLCPNGKEKQVRNGNGSAAPDCDRFTITGCGHGTHVAAIAAGYQRGNHGVAQRADIIPINVFSRFNSSSDCGGSAPCVLAWQSDQMKALEHVLKLVREGRKIASVNMSLGGGRYFSNCDSNPLKPVIDNLKSEGVATVIAAGNNGFDDSVGAPSCISTAVNVGSTTTSDDISSFSNVDQQNDILAPGSSIDAADSANSRKALRTLSGTSMATPHVAGVFALLKNAMPSATVDAMERAMKCTGKQVSRADTPKPRVMSKDALAYLKKPDKNKTFNFNKASSVNQFKNINGNWFYMGALKAMRIIADKSYIWYLTQAPFCANDIRVTAEMKRVDPSGIGYFSGILLSSTASSNGEFTGLMFVYAVTTDKNNYASIRQLNNWDGQAGSGDFETLCEIFYTGKTTGKKRKIVAKKIGNDVSIKVDGKERCTAQTDARFTDGHAGAIMTAPSGDTSHRLDVHSMKFQALQQSSTVTEVSAPSSEQNASAVNSAGSVATALPVSTN